MWILSSVLVQWVSDPDTHMAGAVASCVDVHAVAVYAATRLRAAMKYGAQYPVTATSCIQVFPSCLYIVYVRSVCVPHCSVLHCCCALPYCIYTLYCLYAVDIILIFKRSVCTTPPDQKQLERTMDLTCIHSARNRQGMRIQHVRMVCYSHVSMMLVRT